jgi:hypothetical protein
VRGPEDLRFGEGTPSNLRRPPFLRNQPIDIIGRSL